MKSEVKELSEQSNKSIPVLHEDMENCIIEDLDKEDYHGPIGLSSSGIKKFYQLENKYQTDYLGDSNSTSSMDLGTLVHCLVLEPEKLDERYFLFKGAKRAGVNWQSECLKNEGKEGVLESVWDQAHEMADSINSNASAKYFLSLEGKSEVSLFWRDKTIDPMTGEPTNLLLKAQIDRWILAKDSELYGVPIDLKTTAKDSLEGWTYAKRDYGYWLSIAHYIRGIEEFIKCLRLGIFVIVESKAPYRVRVEFTTKEELELGYRVLDNLLPYFKYCKTNNDWPSYSERVYQSGLDYKDKKLLKKYRIGDTKYKFDKEKKLWQRDH